MYEYVQTAKGWVLYWGGASLQRATTQRPVAAAPEKRNGEGRQATENRKAPPTRAA